MIPNSIDEITPEWLTEALGQQTPGAVITGVSKNRVVHGTSSKWFITVERNQAAIDGGIPEHLCLKVNWEEHAGETLKTAAVWCLEGRFYKYLRPPLPAPAPRGFYGDYDDDSGQGICIMEDLSVLGATYGDNTRPLTPDQAAVANTLRIGITDAFAGGRPQITVNAGQPYQWTSALPAPSNQPNSRSITRGAPDVRTASYGRMNRPVSALQNAADGPTDACSMPAGLGYP